MKFRSTFVGLVIGCNLIAGCAPSRFEDGVAFYADQYRVRDAAARRVKGHWELRFNELIASDLDDAIAAGEAGNDAEMSRLAGQAIRAAGSLATQVAGEEIDRLPPEGRDGLARLAGCPATPAALKAAYRARSRPALDRLLSDIESLPSHRVQQELREIRRNIEAAPDDQGRLGRQIGLAWAAAPAWIGVNAVEADRERQRLARQDEVFEHAVDWQPAEYARDPEMARYAPEIVVEWPEHRDYPADYDRFGEVYLSGTPQRTDVHINTSRPVVYAYRSEAKVADRRYPQLVYVWWFPERPAMTDNDPVAGHIDGDTLRITLDSSRRPAVIEVVQGCGCGHLVYVSQRLEDLARREFGEPEAGKQLAVEKDVKGHNDLIVCGCVNVPDGGAHPAVYVLAGYHEVSRVDFTRAALGSGGGPDRTHTYDLADYDELDHLPLGDSVASMFGPDGLVHNAGRPEGYLLAPTGMLSAGQPRKRGTQKIRWDTYSFEDPRLLEKALRLPKGF